MVKVFAFCVWVSLAANATTKRSAGLEWCPHRLILPVELLEELPLDPESMHYQLFGRKSNPVLVMVHGLDSAGATFLPVVEHLARDFYVVIYDQRGHGRTPDVGWNYSNTVMARDLRSLLMHLKIKRPVHLLGHSLGGRTAARYTSLYPESVMSLIVEDMEMHRRTPEDLLASTLSNAVDISRVIKEATPEAFRTRYELENYLETNYFRSPVTQREMDALIASRARKDEAGGWQLRFRPYVTRLYSSQSNIENLIPSLRQFSGKILFLRSDEGSAMTDWGVQEIRRSLPQTTIQRIEGSLHNIHGSKPRIFINRVRKFLTP